MANEHLIFTNEVFLLDIYRGFIFPVLSSKKKKKKKKVVSLLFLNSCLASTNNVLSKTSLLLLFTLLGSSLFVQLHTLPIKHYIWFSSIRSSQLF